MRNLLVISLLFLHIAGNTELYQLLAVPKIFEHFRLHQLMNPREGFTTFIADHYFGNDGIDADDFKDRELPFMHLSLQNILPATVPPQVTRFQMTYAANASDQFNRLRNISFFYPGHIASLLRPPITA